LAVVHGFEQRALRAAVVRLISSASHHIGEERTRAKDKLARSRLQHRDAENVRGEEIAGELDAMECAAYGEGKGTGQGRLAHTGHVFDEQMAARQQGQDRIADGRRLASDDLAMFRSSRCSNSAAGRSRSAVISRVHRPP